MTETRTGKCLCGRVNFEADFEATHFHACHCASCRRWGGPAMSTTTSDLRVAEGAPLKSFDSSDYGKRIFCSECGTHLFWKMKDGSMTVVWLGTLDDDSGFEFDTQIFVDSKPSHYAFANETAMLTGEQVFAAATEKS